MRLSPFMKEVCYSRVVRSVCYVWGSVDHPASHVKLQMSWAPSGQDTWSRRGVFTQQPHGISYKLQLWCNTLLFSLKRISCYIDGIVITGCTGSCHDDNFGCSQWWQFRQMMAFPFQFQYTIWCKFRSIPRVSINHVTKSWTSTWIYHLPGGNIYSIRGVCN